MSTFLAHDRPVHHHIPDCGYVTCPVSCCVKAHAHRFPCNQTGGRFGLELTFTNATLIELARDQREKDYLDAYHSYYDALIELVQGFDGVSTKDHEVDQYGFRKCTIVLPSKKELFVHSDDWVIEVGASPYSSSDFAEDVLLVEKVLFGSMLRVGLMPHYRIGCGHLHLEYRSHFGDDALLFRNFFVDLLNRPYLFLGGISFDLLNAPPVQILNLAQQEAMQAVIKDFDDLDANSRSIKSLCDAINRRVYTGSYIKGSGSELEDFNQKQNKYQCINLLHDHTIEIRGLRPQASAMTVLSLMRLFEGRICQLKRLNEPIPYVSVNLRSSVSWSVDRNVEKYETTIPAKEIFDALQQYISDSDLSLPPAFIMTDELRGRLDEDVVDPALPHGTVLGVAHGVEGRAANYTNWQSMKSSDFENYIDGLYTGARWQCVEYARRYWLLKYSVLLRNIPMAFNIWTMKDVPVLPLKDDKVVPLRHYPNGGNVPPEVGDLLIYEKHPEQFTGHVAVVVDVREDVVRIAEQNRDNGKMWPGEYSFEMPLLVSSIKRNSGVESKLYVLDDRDCKGLLGWTRLMLDQVKDADPWKARVAINESKLGVANHFWYNAITFLDAYPFEEHPRSIHVLREFLNKYSPAPQFELDENDEQTAKLDYQTVLSLQKFLNLYWKLSAPDEAVFANQLVHVAEDGVFGQETIFAWHRLVLRVGTHTEFGHASRSVLH